MPKQILLKELKRFETNIKSFQRLAFERIELYDFFETSGKFSELNENQRFELKKWITTIKRMYDINQKLIENFSYLKTRILKKLPAEN